MHQYQREIKRTEYKGKAIEYIEVNLDDITLANRFAHEVLGRSLDELPPQTRKLLTHIKDMVSKACKEQQIEQINYRFSRREIREYCGWSDGQLKIHCRRLEEMEYMLVHTGSRGKSIQYELLFDGNPKSKKRHVMGLIDVQQLKENIQYDCEKIGQNQKKAAPSQGQVRPKSALSQSVENLANSHQTTDSQNQLPNLLKNTPTHKNQISHTVVV